MAQITRNRRSRKQTPKAKEILSYTMDQTVVPTVPRCPKCNKRMRADGESVRKNMSDKDMYQLASKTLKPELFNMISAPCELDTAVVISHRRYILERWIPESEFRRIAHEKGG
ncbi:MAG: hypothetical protein KDH96_09930, partial [Candidatus Riesia sp.]|nr:hypothetical protein [Candidatus Riesia sp.]